MSSVYTVCYAPQALDDLRDLYSYVAFSLTGCPARAVPCCGLGTVAEHGDAQVYRGEFSAVLPDRSKHLYRNSRSYCLWWAGSSKPRKIDPCGKFPTFCNKPIDNLGK